MAMDDKVLKKREEIREEDKWLVNEIYSSDEVWEKDFEELKTEAPKLKEFQGKLGSGEKLLEYFEVNEKISRKAEKIYVYAHLRSDEDTANTKYQSMMSRIDAYMAEYATYSAYFVPEILSLEDGFVEKISKESPKSFVIAEVNKMSKVYLSPISSSTLTKRTNIDYNP